MTLLYGFRGLWPGAEIIRSDGSLAATPDAPDVAYWAGLFHFPLTENAECGVGKVNGYEVGLLPGTLKKQETCAIPYGDAGLCSSGSWARERASSSF